MRSPREASQGELTGIGPPANAQHMSALQSHGEHYTHNKRDDQEGAAASSSSSSSSSSA